MLITGKLVRLYCCVLLLVLAFMTNLTWAASFFYIADQANNRVFAIDPATNTINASIPVGNDPQGIVVNMAGTRAYVANGYDNTVSVIDTGTNTLIATVAVGSEPIGIAVNPVGTRVYVTNFGDASVSVIDTSTNSVVATISVGGDPGNVAVNPSGTMAYVTNYWNGTVSVIDTASNSVTASIRIGFGAQLSGTAPEDVAFSSDGTRAYVTADTAAGATNPQDGTVSVIDTGSNTVTTSIPVGKLPGFITINPAGTLAYVTNSYDGTVSVVDTATNTVTATIAVGASPAGVSFNQDGTLAYVANAAFGTTAGGTLAVIDTASNTVTDTLPVGGHPFYLSTAATSPVACPVGDTCVAHIQGLAYTVKGPCSDMSDLATMDSHACVYKNSYCQTGQSCYVSIASQGYLVTGSCPDTTTLSAMDSNSCSYQTHVPECTAGSTCYVTLDGTPYTVTGQCADMSSLSAMKADGCTYTTSNLVFATDLYNQARAEISALRGVKNDTLNTYWSRGEITYYMYLKLLALANADPATLSQQDKDVISYYENLIAQDRNDAALEAWNIYSSWEYAPCNFQIPIGNNPNAYLDTVTLLCAGSSDGQPILGMVTGMPAPSAEEFAGWAEGIEHNKDLDDWGNSIKTQVPGLTDAQAKGAGNFEYDQLYSEVQEGQAYLTAVHSDLGPNLDTSTAAPAESDLQQEWGDAVKDFAGDKVQEEVLSKVLDVGQGLIDPIDEGAAGAADEVGAAAAEDAVGSGLEFYETAVGPAIAYASVAVYVVWQHAADSQLHVAINNELTDSTTVYPLSEYAQDPAGRERILKAVVKSMLPAYYAKHIADPTYGSASSPGPDLSTDPVFKQGIDTPKNAFQVQDWEGVGHTYSVRDGWFIEQNGQAWDYVPSAKYVTDDWLGDNELWRAWLDGVDPNGNPYVINERYGVVVGQAYVTEGALVSGAVGSCDQNTPTLDYKLTVGSGLNCVIPYPGTPFTVLTGTDPNTPDPVIRVGDDVEIDGQVRQVSAIKMNGSTEAWFMTSKPFIPPNGDPSIALSGPVVVLAHPDGNCMTTNSLGDDRAQGNDCYKGGGFMPSPYPGVSFLSTAYLNMTKLTITAASGEMTVGDPIPTITPSYNGQSQPPQNPEFYPPTCSTTYKAGDPAGTYVTQCSGAIDHSGSYFIAYVNGTLNVYPASSSGTGNGIPASVENAVPDPNGTGTGDGNGDGTQDSLQLNVASLPLPQSQSSGDYATIVSADGTTLSNITVLSNPTQPLPSGATTPDGEIAFTATGVKPYATAEFILYLPYDPKINSLLKFNRETNQWDNIASSITQVGSKTEITFFVENGGPYDADGIASNDVIQDPLVPANMPAAPPPPPPASGGGGGGAFGFPSLLAALAGLALRRRRQ